MNFLMVLTAVGVGSVFGQVDTATAMSRIIGGFDVDTAPTWTVSLRINNHFCGGTLIDSTHVLTAAHCVLEIESITQGFLSGDVYAYIGGTKISSTDQWQRSQVIHGMCHPNYDPESFDWDCCVLTLKDAIDLPVVPLNGIDNANSDFEALESVGQTTTVFGWGVTNVASGATSDTLKYVNVPILSSRLCESAYYTYQDARMFCAGDWENGGADSCSGDSGGPVIVDGVQVGITSFGSGCADARFPGVYSKVSAFADFITQVISTNESSTDSAVDEVAGLLVNNEFYIQSGSSGTKALIIGVAAGAGAALVLIVVGSVWVIRRRRNFPAGASSVGALEKSGDLRADTASVDIDVVTGETIVRGMPVGDA
eukprot:CFRG6946T1